VFDYHFKRFTHTTVMTQFLDNTKA